MRALRVHAFGPVENLRIDDIDAPVPAAEEVAIDVASAELNFPDVLLVEGRYQLKPPLPFSPGTIAVGKISAIGRDVCGHTVGERVLAHLPHGAFAETVCAKAEHCVAVPADIPSDKAAALGLPYQTAWFALRERARLSRDESVLVLGGASAVGLASIGLAKAFGAGRVIAAIRGQRGVDLVRSAGADEVVDLTAENLRDSLRSQVLAANSGQGAEIIIDPIGGDAATAALRAIGWNGRYIVVGFAAGQVPQFNAGHLLVKNISVSGLQSTDYRDRFPQRAADARREIFLFYRSGLIDAPIAARVPLERVAEGLSMIRDGTVKGRVVLEMNAHERPYD